MRTLIFLLFVACLGTSSQAQEKLSVTRIQTIVMPIAQTVNKTEVLPQKSQTAARFFKVKNARVKRALLFKPRSRRALFA